jgi:hypothetical protein
MAEHLLNDLHIRAGRDGQARGRVAQFVRVKAGNLQRFGCSCQRGALKCLRPHDGPTLASEEQFLRRSAGHVHS